MICNFCLIILNFNKIIRFIFILLEIKIFFYLHRFWIFFFFGKKWAGVEGVDDNGYING